MTSHLPPFGPGRLPLIPLQEEVCFPCTELRLRLVEPIYERLVTEVKDDPRNGGWLGLVLLRPDHEWQPGESAVYAAGTAARLLDVDSDPDGSQILLEGCFRFEIERVFATGRWREGWVQPVDEPRLCEQDPGILSLRQELLQEVEGLSSELGERFALGRDELAPLSKNLPFETLVNHLAANLDLLPHKKLMLLRCSLPDRASNLLSILRGRRRVLDVLRPFRRLAPYSSLH